MNVTSKGQVIIPRAVRESMGIIPSQTNIAFKQDKENRWYIVKEQPNNTNESRFKTAHKKAKINITTEEIMALTRT